MCLLQQDEVKAVTVGLQPCGEGVIRGSAKPTYIKGANPESLARSLVASSTTALSQSRAFLQWGFAAKAGAPLPIFAGPLALLVWTWESAPTAPAACAVTLASARLVCVS